MTKKKMKVVSEELRDLTFKQLEKVHKFIVETKRSNH